MAVKIAIKAGRKGAKAPGQGRPYQPHAPDRGKSAVTALGINYGSSGVPTENIRQFGSARLYRPLPQGM